MADSFLERVWRDREEVLYRDLFGDLGEGIYPLPQTDDGLQWTGSRARLPTRWRHGHGWIRIR